MQTSGQHTAKFTRRAPSAREQARRKAWGALWGKVGHEHKLRRPARKGSA